MCNLIYRFNCDDVVDVKNSFILIILIAILAGVLLGSWNNENYRNNLELELMTHWDSSHRILTIHPTGDDMILCIEDNCQKISKWLDR